MAKKKQDLSPEERLAAALVPEEDWPYALPDGWKWVYLGEITTIVGGGTPSSRCPEYYDDGKIPWITPADLSDYNGVYISHGRRNITQLGLEKSSAKLMPENTVLLSSRAPIGYVAIAANDICTNQGFKSFLPSIHFIPEYLYWFLKGNQALLQQYASGTTFLELSSRRASEIKLPIPPLSEQRRLVARIESLFAKLDAAKDKVQSVLDSHETRKAALLHDAFTGKLTAKWREENNKRACYAEEPLKNFVETQYGYTEKSSFDIAGPHYLRITDIQGETVDWNNVPNCSIDETNYQKYSLHPNDIVVARTGATTGKSYMIGEDIDAVFASYLIRVQITNIRLLPKFLYMFFQSQEYWSQIMELSAGIAQPGVNARKIQSMMICVPSLPEQQEIIRILDRLLAREQRARQAAEETLAAIDRMKQAILARAFRGEL